MDDPTAAPSVERLRRAEAGTAGVLAVVGASASAVTGHPVFAAVWAGAWLAALHLLLSAPVMASVDGLARTVGRGVAWLAAECTAEAGRIRRSVTQQRELAWTCVAGGVGTMALIGPSMWRMAHGRATGYFANDWLPFIQAVHETGFWPPRLTTPHFLFPSAGAVLRVATQTTPATATALTGIVGLGATGAVLVWFFHRPWAGRGVPLPLPVCLVATWLFVVSDLPQYLFFGQAALTFDRLNVSLHQWNTPSSAAVEWMQLLLLIAVARLARADAPGRRWVFWVAVLTLVTVLTLPAMTMALAVGAPIFLWRTGRLDRWRLFAMAFVMPLAVGLALEVLESILWLKPGWNPPLQFELGGSLNRLDLWGPGLGVLVPVVIVAVLGWRSFCEPDEVRLAGWSLLWALVMLLTLSLGGPREEEGNIGRVAFSVAWVSYLFIVRWVLELARDWRAWRAWPIRRKVAIPLVVTYAVISIVGGLLLYLEQAGLIRFTGASI